MIGRGNGVEVMCLGIDDMEETECAVGLLELFCETDRLELYCLECVASGIDFLWADR